MNSTFITAKRLAFSSRYRRFLYPRPRIQEPAISAAESQALGRDERRIHRSSQNEGSRVKWHLLTNSRSEPYVHRICRSQTSSEVRAFIASVVAVNAFVCSTSLS